MHAVVRRYRVRFGTAVQVATHARRALLPLVKQVPGFVAYHLLDAGSDVLASLGFFETSEGAEASTRLLRAWFESDWPAFQEIPQDALGEVITSAEIGRAPVTASLDFSPALLTQRRRIVTPRKKGKPLRPK